jgi:hypothetical protein
VVVTDPSRAEKRLVFRAHHSDLANIVRSAWFWHRKAHPGKKSTSLAQNLTAQEFISLTSRRQVDD